MTTSRRPPLELERLDARVLPSLTPLPIPLPPVHPAAPLVRESDVATHLLDGHGQGTYTGLVVVDAGPSFRLEGTADLAGMGHVKVSGWVQGVGMIAKGRAHGFLTFTNDRGSITLEIFGPPQAGFSSLPEHFNWNIVGHRTGDFAHMSGKGTLTLDLHALPTGDLLPPHGTFDLTVGTPRPPGSL
jgi:hypothetical protein